MEWEKIRDRIIRQERVIIGVSFVVIFIGGVALSWWIKHQRKRYKENKISEREIALLNQIGMVWNV